jgi:hypothetical protein
MYDFHHKSSIWERMELLPTATPKDKRIVEPFGQAQQYELVIYTNRYMSGMD